MNIIMLGAPGAGKGTQAVRLSAKLSVPHISTGDIFRENIKDMTEIGKLAKEYMDKGQLVPDEVTVEIVKRRLAEKDCENGYILDGFPRTVYQAQELDKITAIDAVVNIEISAEKVIQRLSGRRVCESCGESYHIEFIGDRKDCQKCGGKLFQRADDNEKTILERINVYTAKTAPLIEYYEKAEKLVSVMTGGGMDAVENRIIKALENRKVR